MMEAAINEIIIRQDIRESVIERMKSGLYTIPSTTEDKCWKFAF
jgi:hypothetical protein